MNKEMCAHKNVFEIIIHSKEDRVAKKNIEPWGWDEYG